MIGKKKKSELSFFNRKNVKSYMNNVYENHVDKAVGEVNYTSLVESAASYFEQDHMNGPLDDPDHWIWEIALEIKK